MLGTAAPSFASPSVPLHQQSQQHVLECFTVTPLYSGFDLLLALSSHISLWIVQVVAEAQDQIPAVHAGRAARRSSSLKLGAQAAWDKVVLVPVRHTKKSFASAAENMRKASLRRTSSIGTDPATPTSTPGNPPSRTSSLKKTVSNLGNRLAPANCLGKHTTHVCFAAV